MGLQKYPPLFSQCKLCRSRSLQAALATYAFVIGVQLDYLERLILKKYPQWKHLTFKYYNNDDFMDDLIDKLSKIESKLESLRTNIESGAIYSHKES